MADTVDPIEAELEKLDAEETKPPSSAVRRLLPVLLAAVTLAAFGGVVWYAYSKGVREGSEFAAPTLKPEGPSKVAPKNPGGEQIADQDKLVYGKIDRSSESRKVERLLPPPENPLPAPIAKPPPLPAPKLEVPKAPPTSDLPAPPPTVPAPPSGTKVAAPVEKKPVPEAAKPDPALAKISPSAGQPGAPVKRSETPRPPEPKVVAKSAVSDPGKGYRIQIGSLRSETAAKAAWDRQVKKYGDILDGLTLLVKRADLGKKGVYYRVQAGPFADKGEAQRICEALKGQKVGCFVVRP